MSRQFLKSRWFVLLITLVVVGMWGWIVAEQMDALRQYPWEIAPLALTLGLVAGSIYFAGLAYSWALLLQEIVQPAVSISLVAAARVWLLSMMTRYIPGNVWHILGRIAFAQSLNVAKTQVLTSATIEQVLTLLGALAVFVAMLPFWQVLPEQSAWLGLLLPIGLLLLHPQIMGRVLAWGAHRFRRPELVWHYTFYDVLRLLLVFAIANLLSGLALCALLSGLTTVALRDWPFLIGAACLAWCVGYLSFLTPSGLGVRETVLSAMLVLVYPLPVAVVGSLLFRVVLTLGEGVAVAVAWLTTRHRGH